MRFFVLHIFDGVILDEHPIFWLVDALDAGITKILDAHPWWHCLRSAKQKKVLCSHSYFRIVLFLHNISVIYLSILNFTFFGMSWIITSLLKINVSIQITTIARCSPCCLYAYKRDTWSAGTCQLLNTNSTQHHVISVFTIALVMDGQWWR